MIIMSQRAVWRIKNGNSGQLKCRRMSIGKTRVKSTISKRAKELKIETKERGRENQRVKKKKEEWRETKQSEAETSPRFSLIC